MNPSQVLKVITKINNKINNDQTYLTLKTNGFDCSVEFLSFRIWCSSDDNRKFDDNKNDYESLETFLKRTMKDTIQYLFNELAFPKEKGQD
jgi:hypothetical protein